MQVREVIWLPEIEDKLWQKHRMAVIEAEEVLFGRPHVRFVEHGHQPNGDLYAALDRQEQDATSSWSSS